MKYYVLAGIMLQYFAFWLALPELIGNKNIERYSKWLTWLIKRLPRYTLIIIIVVTVSLSWDEVSFSEIKRSPLLIFLLIVELSILFVIRYYRNKIELYLEKEIGERLVNKLVNEEVKMQSLPLPV